MYKTDKGYVLVRVPKHPRANAQGYVKRARLVLEQKLGRSLQPDEEIHHINRVRDDDRPENLEALTKSAHSRLHAGLQPHRSWETRTCVVCGASVTRRRFERAPERTTCGFSCRNRLVTRLRLAKAG